MPPSRDVWDDHELNLKFKNKGVEKAWKENFSRNKINYDCVSLAIGFIINIASAKKIDPSFTGWIKTRALFYIIYGIVTQFLHFWVLYRHGEYFHKNRERIIVSRTVLLIIMHYLCVVSCLEIYHSVLPLQIDTQFVSSIARHVLFFPFLRARVNIAYLVPLREAKYIFLVGLPLSLYFNTVRCSHEIAQVAGQGLFYKYLVKMIERQFLKWVPLPHFCVLGDAVRAAQLTETGACIAVRYSPAVILEYFIPMVIYYTEEMNSRKKFEMEHGLGPAFCHKPSTLLILHALLLPFQAAVTFHTIVYIAWLTREWL